MPTWSFIPLGGCFGHNFNYQRCRSSLGYAKRKWQHCSAHVCHI